MAENIEIGKLGKYAVDGDSRDLSYGLFMLLQGHRVFVDIKEDGLIEERKQRAIQLCEGREKLEASLVRFIERNAEYRNRKLASLGLHSNDLQQAEVFWDPEGYTLLRGFEFSDASAA